MRADVLTFGAIELDVRKRRVTREGLEVPLTERELSVLEFFLTHPAQTFSPEAILARVWPANETGSIDGVRACIKRIQEKLDFAGQPSVIRNVQGYGYKLNS